MENKNSIVKLIDAVSKVVPSGEDEIPAITPEQEQAFMENMKIILDELLNKPKE